MNYLPYLVVASMGGAFGVVMMAAYTRYRRHQKSRLIQRANRDLDAVLAYRADTSDAAELAAQEARDRVRMAEIKAKAATLPGDYSDPKIPLA